MTTDERYVYCFITYLVIAVEVAIERAVLDRMIKSAQYVGAVCFWKWLAKSW